MGAHGGTVRPSAGTGCPKSSHSLFLCNPPHGLGNSAWYNWSENAALEPPLEK